MIIGAILVSIGITGLFGLNIWPVLLIGLGSGLILSGVTGRLDWLGSPRKANHSHSSSTASNAEPERDQGEPNGPQPAGTESS